MRKSLLLAVFTVSCAGGPFAGAAEDLLSDIRLDSTVAPSEAGRPAGPLAPRRVGKSVGGAGSLQTLLLAAGYSAKVTGDDEVTVSLSRSDWTADVRITLASDARQLRLAMQLTNPDENTDIALNTFRGLLEANRKQWGMAFAVAGDEQRIELLQAIPNESLTAARLREDIEAMADHAESTKDLWNPDGGRSRSGEAPAAPADTSSAPSTTNAQTTSPAPASSLTGKWIASPTTSEAFALQLDADGSFRLVHVKGSKSTRSKGTYQLTSTSLTLKANDGNTLAGTVTRQSGSFTFSLKGTGGKTVTLTFKSSS